MIGNQFQKPFGAQLAQCLANRGSTDADFVGKVSGNFQTVDDTLAKYKAGDGYETYDKLSEADRTVLAAAVNTLAEDLSTLRGKLGLD